MSTFLCRSVVNNQTHRSEEAFVCSFSTVAAKHTFPFLRLGLGSGDFDFVWFGQFVHCVIRNGLQQG